ncbi:Dolichyl-phosphate-mannose-protein mannosyltransferase [uncultured archaeon]|nr:Dolichyl-phosphate-mannose-protein mannosyltransferase [uncultured archaeon]
MDRRLLVVLLLALVLRTVNVETIPYWHWDEGVNLHLAWNLAHGESRWFALAYRWVPHPPLYFMVLGLVLRLAGYTILVGRLFNVALSLATCFVVYLLGREVDDERTGLVAALAYAVSPFAVYWGRLSYSNNLVSLIAALSLFLLLTYFRTKNPVRLYVAAFVSGLAAVTGYNGFFVPLSLGAVILLTEKRSFPAVIIISSLPFLAFAAVMFRFDLAGFIHDLNYQFFRFGGPSPLWRFLLLFAVAYYIRKTKLAGFFVEIWKMIVRDAPVYWAAYAVLLVYPHTDDSFLMGFDPYFIGALGLVSHPSTFKKFGMRTYFAFAFLMAFALNRVDHMLIPLHPLLALGVGRIAVDAYGLNSRYVRRLSNAGTVALLLTSIPFAAAALSDVALVGFGYRVEHQNLDGFFGAAARVREITRPGDVVLTYSQMDYLLPDTLNGELVQSVPYNGVAVTYYAGDFPPERWLFNTSIQNARAVVLSNGTLKWANETAGFEDVYAEISKWPREDVGQYLILLNPRKRV